MEACDGGRLEGGGCLGFRSPDVICRSDLDGDTGADSGLDTGYAAEGGGGDLGGAQGCSALAVPVPLPAILVIVWVLARRLVWAALFVGVAHGQEIEHLQPLDGGRFTSLIEGDLGDAWSMRSWMSSGWAYRPVTVRTGKGREAFVDHLVSADVGLSMRIANWPRVFLGWGLRGTVGRQAGIAPGDVIVGLQVPILPIEHRGGALALHAYGEARTGSGPWAGHPSALVGVAWERQTGPLRLGLNTSLRFQSQQPIRGADLGRRLELGGAVGWRGDRVGLSAEVFGAVPFTTRQWSAGQVPWEFLLASDLRVKGSHRLRVYGGLGLSRGVGTPAARLGLGWTTDITPRDQDRDRIWDMADQCVNSPEDRDRFQDRDGCPEHDNDRDGILDRDDDCPDDPEVFNDFEDEDGCPDSLVTWTVEVVADGRVEAEVVELSLLEREPTQILIGDTLTVEAPPGVALVEISGEGIEPLTLFRRLPRVEEHRTVVSVRQAQIGVITVALYGDGEPIAGEVRLDERARVVGVDGDSWTVRRGDHTLVASAEGFATRTVPVTVPRAGHAVVDVDLVRNRVRREGSRLVMAEQVLFRTDESEVDRDAVESVEVLARWLKEHPEVRLLRVEGHADGPGDSAYNLELSNRRAGAVVNGLVSRGVDPARLQALGSGEAHVDQGRQRRVGFVVLVWKD